MSRFQFSQHDVVTVLVLLAVVGWSAWRTIEVRRLTETVQDLETRLNRSEQDRKRAADQARYDLAGQREWSLYWKADAEEIRTLAEKSGVTIPNYKPIPTHGELLPPEGTE